MGNKTIPLFLILFAFATLISCAGVPLQTTMLLEHPTELPERHLIENVNFIDQTKGYCGPATLAMSLLYQGHPATVDEIAAQVYTPVSIGSFPSDMISASRRRGMVAIPINTMYALISEIANNNPVIVFENLGVDWAPQWHFALAVGYDLKTKELIMHSGHTPLERTDMKYFERSWRLGEYWGLAVLSPDKLSATGSENEHLKAAVGLEKAKNFHQAKLSYQQILKKWPDSLVALVGLGNISYQEGDLLEAIARLSKAVKVHPQSKAARHNLEVALE